MKSGVEFVYRSTMMMQLLPEVKEEQINFG